MKLLLLLLIQLLFYISSLGALTGKGSIMNIPVEIQVVETLQIGDGSGIKVDFGSISIPSTGNSTDLTSSTTEFVVRGTEMASIRLYLEDDDGDDVTAGEVLELVNEGDASKTIAVTAYLTSLTVSLPKGSGSDGVGSSGEAKVGIYGVIDGTEITSSSLNGVYKGTINIKAVYY